MLECMTLTSFNSSALRIKAFNSYALRIKDAALSLLLCFVLTG